MSTEDRRRRLDQLNESLNEESTPGQKQRLKEELSTEFEDQLYLVKVFQELGNIFNAQIRKMRAEMIDNMLNNL